MIQNLNELRKEIEMKKSKYEHMMQNRTKPAPKQTIKPLAPETASPTLRTKKCVKCSREFTSVGIQCEPCRSKVTEISAAPVFGYQEERSSLPIEIGIALAMTMRRKRRTSTEFLSLVPSY